MKKRDFIKKNWLKRSMVFAAAAVVLTAVLLISLTPVYAAGVDPGTYYTNEQSSAVIPLQGIDKEYCLGVYDDSVSGGWVDSKTIAAGSDSVTILNLNVTSGGTDYYIVITDEYEVNDLKNFEYIGENKIGSLPDHDDTLSVVKINVVLDTTDPKGSYEVAYNDLSVDGGWYKSATITIKDASDDMLHSEPYGIKFNSDSTVWKNNNVTEIDKNGTYEVKIRDAAGNELTIDTLIVTNVDGIEPQITDVTGNPGTWTNKAVTLTVTATDDAPGAVLQYSFDGGINWQSDKSKEFTESKTVNIKVRDKAGNIAECTEEIKIDNKAPVIDIKSIVYNDPTGQNEGWFKATSAEIIFTVSQNGGSPIDESSISYAPVNAAYSANFSTHNIPEGYKATLTLKPGDKVFNSAITITVGNEAGNQANKQTVAIKIDNEAPQVTIDPSNFGKWHDGWAEFEVSANDNGCSGVNWDSLKVTIPGVSDEDITKTPKITDVYIIRVNAESKKIIDDEIEIYIEDNVGNSATETSGANLQIDNYEVTANIVSITKTEGTADDTVVKNGDKIEVIFEFEDNAIGGVSGCLIDEDRVVAVLGTKSEKAVLNGGKYSATITVNEFPMLDNQELKLTIGYYKKTDVGTGERTALEKNSGIKFYHDIDIKTIKIESNNAKDKSTARGDNEISVIFESGHPVNISNATANGGVKYKETKVNGLIYNVIYEIPEDHTLTDLDRIIFSFELGDNAGNVPVTATNENGVMASHVTYYAPIDITNLTIVSDNKNDPAKYAKDEDTITVSFTLSHSSELTNATIAGKSAIAKATDTEKKAYEFKYTVQNGVIPDVSEIQFSFNVEDAAGNTASKTNKSDGVKNKITYYAPISTSATIESSNYNKAYVCNDSTVVVFVNANHPVSIVNARIGGRNAKYPDGATQKPDFSYAISVSEYSMKEGILAIAYNLNDVAGNTYQSAQTSDGSSVIYDRTLPIVDVTPNFSGFTNGNVTFTATFSDTNLDGSELIFTVNGEDMLTRADRNSAGTKLTKSITLKEDNSYTVICSATDKAGNRAVRDVVMNVVIKTTSPEIRTVGISLDMPKTIKSGFVISDYFQIDDPYLKEVICTITDSTGVHDWDINTPVTTEGKITIYLLATDMAGNTSASVTYDFYVDGTLPQPLVFDEIEQKLIKEGKSEFTGEASLKISLEELNIGDEQPDHFTKIQLFDKSGKLLNDLLEETPSANDGVYNLHITDIETYTLLISAVDDVGNEINDLEYNLVLREKSIVEIVFADTPLAAAPVLRNNFVFIGIIVGIILALALVIFFIIRRVKQNKNEAEYAEPRNY